MTLSLTTVTARGWGTQLPGPANKRSNAVALVPSGAEAPPVAKALWHG